MLTAIYVYEPSTVKIEARNPHARALLRRYPGRVKEDRPALGTLQLEPGIYAILSSEALQLAWTSGRAEALALDKDEWPDPPSLEAGASRTQIREFFDQIVKGGDV